MTQNGFLLEGALKEIMHIFGEVYRMCGSCVYMLMRYGNLHIFPNYITTTVFYNVVYSKLIPFYKILYLSRMTSHVV